FKVTPNGKFTTLVDFNKTNGSKPYGGLMQAKNGNFYGTTSEGGKFDLGTIFKVTPNGKFTTLVDFNNLNGALPYARLIQSNKNGNFYGTTKEGGFANCGSIFKLTANGTLTTLVNFNRANGAYPYAGLIQASDGSFYGTTREGGKYPQRGTVFKLTLPDS
ncbi:MAG: choice-of-anchor tandem repeat GloVer-containing protein, partial [Thermosynechococcaceae cyanobacterium]